MPQHPPIRGEVWRILTPDGPDEPDQRPLAFVISDNIRNYSTKDVIIIPIFPEGAPAPTHVSLPKGEEGLPRDGVLFCERITTIEQQRLVEGPLGLPVAGEKLAEVVRAVRRAIGETSV